ncbi:MAG: TerB family tellurite resistance protein [Pseudomonadota bacterium]
MSMDTTPPSERAAADPQAASDLVVVGDNQTLWQRIQAGIDEARRRTLGVFLDALAQRKARRDEAAFSIALIALSAKMAKADGVVTDDEVAAFRDFFSYPAEQESKVRMLYQLAQQDVAGYELYLTRVAKLYDGQCPVLEDVLDCLFYVAMADGVAHPAEIQFLDQAAAIFDMKPTAYRRLKALHLGIGDDDPWLVLGLKPGLSPTALKKAYHALVKENHPDALVARGVPIDLIKIAESRMAAINAAYEKILAEGV